MINQMLSMFMRKQQKKKQKWGVWMSVLAALGVGATAIGMARGKNGGLSRTLGQQGNTNNN